MAMDRKIEKKTWTPRKIAGITVVAVVAAGLLYFAFRPSSGTTQRVNEENLVIRQVSDGPFQEFIDITGTVQPVQTTYLDAIEGGVVQRVYLESGSMVQPGDTIVALSNSNLQLSVLQQEAGLYDQINNVRNSRLNLEQNHLNLRKELASARTMLEQYEARFHRDSTLFSGDLISSQDFEETRQNYRFQKMRFDLTYESYRKDSLQVQQQLRQLDDSEQRMWRSLDGVQRILDNLVVTAPLEGQLSTIELDPGQSIRQGERIGQVDLLDGFKIRAGIDEFYLARIVTGLQGTFSFANREYRVEISRVFPVIQDGQFQVDLELIGDMPESLRRGQTVRIRLELGDSTTATLLPRGGFFQQTGGSWVYRLNESADRAYRQPIRLGRGNSDFFEVIEGLAPGDRVITSSYADFNNRDVLILN
jgi:HlyD family secretion protein